MTLSVFNSIHEENYYDSIHDFFPIVMITLTVQVDGLCKLRLFFYEVLFFWKHSKRFTDSEMRAIIHARMQQTQQEV